MQQENKNYHILDKVIIIASHNDGKITEFRDMLEEYNFKIFSSKDFNLKEPVENGLSFEENALIKSRYTAKNAGYLSLSDDSGLCIDALDGKPGIFSARFAGSNNNFDKAMKKLNKSLSNKNNKSCKFICSLSLCWPDGKDITVTGEVHGTFVWPPRGNLGFGYDPVFQPDGYTKTFGELNPEIKHKISHRQKAFIKLKKNTNLFKKWKNQ